MGRRRGLGVLSPAAKAAIKAKAAASPVHVGSSDRPVAIRREIEEKCRILGESIDGAEGNIALCTGLLVPDLTGLTLEELEQTNEGVQSCSAEELEQARCSLCRVCGMPHRCSV